MKICEDRLSLIQALSDAPGAPGFEDEVVKVARKEAESYARMEEDAMRNLYLYRKKNTGNKPVVMLEAHSDEVGFMVHSIRPNGTLRVVNIGIWTLSTLPAAKMLVRNALGEYIPALFSLAPPHFTECVGKPFGDVSVSSLSLDVGATSREDAIEKFHIRIGEPVVPATRFEADREHDLLFGKAFDCRIGCAALLETMRRLDEIDNLPCDVVGVLSSQEELGERGCRVSVNHVKPDVALCLEGCPADDTFTEEYAVQTALKKGPMLRHMDESVICSPRLQRFILDLAAEKGLAVQEAVREGGGNDASVINNALLGIPVVTAGVPVRYSHAVNGITSYFDFDATAALLTETVKALTPEVIQGL